MLTKILYAEDEPDIRAIVQIALEDIGGFTVKYCHNGQEVLEEIKHCKPDLFLLDVMMPGMDGLSLLNELKKLKEVKDIPVILMTAKVQKKELDEYLAKGVAGIINKPFDPTTLAQQITLLWSRYYG